MANGKNDIYIRHIENVTILANVGERVDLPNPIVAHYEDGSVQPVYVKWEDKPLDVSTAVEFIYVGRVDGYALDVLCSIQIGRQEDNPASSFPECIDQFGIQKRDIQTEDIPHIDDYQYFKAKIPRTLVEEYHLKQLREKVADQVILARDINHLRNAVIEIEKYIWLMQDQLDELFDRVEDLERRVTELEERVTILEDRVDWIEDNMVIDGDNIGSGVGVFSSKRNRVLEFKSLVGEGVNISDMGDTISFQVDEPEGGDPDMCGQIIKGKTFLTCDQGNDIMPAYLTDGMLAFSEFFNFQLVQIESSDPKNTKGFYWSLMGVFGIGNTTPLKPSHGTPSSLYAGRFLKGETSMIFEVKTGEGEYSGLVIGGYSTDRYINEFYVDRTSYLESKLYEPMDIYSGDVGAGQRPNRYESEKRGGGSDREDDRDRDRDRDRD